MTVPIKMTGPTANVVGGVQTAPITIEVASVPSSGGYVQIGTDQPSVIVSPSGSWPYMHFVPPGSPREFTINFATNGVSSSTQVLMFAAEQTADLSDPANWRVQAGFTVVD